MDEKEIKITELIDYLLAVKDAHGDIPLVEWGYLGWDKKVDLARRFRPVDCRSQVRGELEECYKGLMIFREPDPPRG